MGHVKEQTKIDIYMEDVDINICNPFIFQHITLLESSETPYKQKVSIT